MSDSWLDALTKLIPGEIIVAFTAVLQVPGVDDGLLMHLVLVTVFTALVPVVLWASAWRAGTAVHWLQYAARTTAFVLYGVGNDPILMSRLGDPAWIPIAGVLVLTLLTALVLVPPGAQRSPRNSGSRTGAHPPNDPPPRI